MAVDDINGSGGILGEPVLLTQAGGELNRSEGALHGIELPQQTSHISAVVGTASTIEQYAKGTPNRTVEAATLATINDQPDVPAELAAHLQLSPPVHLLGSALAQALLQDNVDTLAIVARSDHYGQSIGTELSRAFKDGGGRVPVHLSYDQLAQSLTATADELLAQNADAIAIVGYEESQIITDHLIAGGTDPRDIWLAGDVRGGAPVPLSAGVRGTRQNQSRVQELAARLRTELATEPQFTWAAASYDAVALIALAAESAGSTDGRSIAGHVPALTDELGQECETIPACLRLIHEGKQIQYSGFLGPLHFTDADLTARVAYEIWEITDDGVEVLGNLRMTNDD